MITFFSGRVACVLLGWEVLNRFLWFKHAISKIKSEGLSTRHACIKLSYLQNHKNFRNIVLLRRVEHISGWTRQMRNELFSSSSYFSAVVYTTSCYVLFPSSFTSLRFFCRRFISWKVVPLRTLLGVISRT